MFQPYVVGQSGTLRPDSVLVTRPPTKMRNAVQKAVNKANRWSAMLSSDMASKRGLGGAPKSPFLLVGGLVVGAEAESDVFFIVVGDGDHHGLLAVLLV